MEVKIPEVTLNDGLRIPVIGLGTYQLRGVDRDRHRYGLPVNRQRLQL